jgi:hypothetical protein
MQMDTRWLTLERASQGFPIVHPLFYTNSCVRSSALKFTLSCNDLFVKESIAVEGENVEYFFY